MCIYYISFQAIHWWTLLLLPPIDCCVKCCCEHGCADYLKSLLWILSSMYSEYSTILIFQHTIVLVFITVKYSKWKIMPVSLNVLDEAVNINFIKFQSSSTHWKMCDVEKYAQRISVHEITIVVLRKSSLVPLSFWANCCFSFSFLSFSSPFSSPLTLALVELHFYLKGGVKTMVIKKVGRYMADIFLKTKQVCYFKENNRQYLLLEIKFSDGKSEFLKTYCLSLSAWQLSQYI